jgi:hypothetical protein
MTKGDFIILCIFFLFVVWNYLSFQKQKREALKTIEMQFLFGTMYFISYKENMLKMLEIIYEKAGESDPQFIKDYESIKKKVEEREELLGNQWIKNLRDVLKYETEYENWDQVTKYIKQLSKSIDKHGPGKDD